VFITKKILNLLLLINVSFLFSACGSNDTLSSFPSATGDEKTESIEGYKENSIVDSNGVEYKTVTSPFTKRVWIDRNVGASELCISLDDQKCYGYYFQWGRGSDGHEKLSSTTTILATDISNTGHSNFILNTTVDESKPNDWATSEFSDGSIRSYNWSKIDGSSICPVGFRVPTNEEISLEVKNINNNEDAFSSFLKLPSAGYAAANDGLVHFAGEYGTLWSSTTDNDKSKHFGFYKDGVQRNHTSFRGGGFSVRCIKD